MSEVDGKTAAGTWVRFPIRWNKADNLSLYVKACVKHDTESGLKWFSVMAHVFAGYPPVKGSYPIVHGCAPVMEEADNILSQWLPSVVDLIPYHLVSVRDDSEEHAALIQRFDLPTVVLDKTPVADTLSTQKSLFD